MNKELIYQNKKIFYRVEGAGPTIVLIHGFGEDGNVWKNQIAAFSKNYRFIVPDLPGSGLSELTDDMSIEGMAETIKAILDVESSEVPLKGVPTPIGIRGVLIGHSMGGYITLAFTEKWPEYLNAIGLIHSTGYADSDEKKAARRKSIDFIQENGSSEFLKTAIPNLFAPKTRENNPELISAFMGALRNFSPAALVNYYEAMMQRPDRISVLKNAAFLVLFMIGENDGTIPMQDMLEQSHLPEKSYIYILSKSGHMGMLEEPEACNAGLAEFFSETS